MQAIFQAIFQGVEVYIAIIVLLVASWILLADWHLAQSRKSRIAKKRANRLHICTCTHYQHNNVPCNNIARYTAMQPIAWYTDKHICVVCAANGHPIGRYTLSSKVLYGANQITN